MRCRIAIRTESGQGCADFVAEISLTPAGIFTGGQVPRLSKSLRKEVIQPQVLLRLPCYDLVPVTSFAVGTTESWRLKALPASMT